MNTRETLRKVFACFLALALIWGIGGQMLSVLAEADTEVTDVSVPEEEAGSIPPEETPAVEEAVPPNDVPAEGEMPPQVEVQQEEMAPPVEAQQAEEEPVQELNPELPVPEISEPPVLAEENTPSYNTVPISGTAEGKGVRLDVLAPAGSFPDGTAVLITSLPGSETTAAFDISFFDPQGNRVQPEAGREVQLSITVASDSVLLGNGGETRLLSLFHVSDNGNHELLQSVVSNGEGVQMQTNAASFSEYYILSEALEPAENEAAAEDEAAPPAEEAVPQQEEEQLTDSAPEEESTPAEEELVSEPAAMQSRGGGTRAEHNDVITSTEFFHANGGPLNVGDVVVMWERLKVQMAFELPDNTVHEGDTTVITIPPQLNFGDVSGFPIKDADGNIVANATFNAAARTVTLTYTDYPEHHSGVKGKFFFLVMINHFEYDDEQDIPIEISVGGEVIHGPTVHFPGIADDEPEIFDKNSWKEGDTQLAYSIRINQKKQAISNVVVTDAIQTPGVTIDKSSFRVYKGTWYLHNHEWTLDQTAANNVTSQFINQVVWNYNADGKAIGFTLPIGNIGPDDGYLIRYISDISYQPVNGEHFKNDATLTGTEIQPITIHAGMHYTIGGGIAEGYVFKIHVVKKDDSTPPLPVSGAKFRIVRKSNQALIGEFETDSQGEIMVGNLLRDTYIITETYVPDGYVLDTTPKEVNPADFTANQIALVNVTNNKALPVTWTPVATKALSGLPLADNQFEFELKEGAAVLQTKKNKADGSIPFDAISYSIADVGEHTYTITEKTGALAGITYDNLTITYKVKVSKKADGNLSVELIDPPADTEFNNSYAASGSWVPSVSKALTGRTLADDEFEFELKEGAAVLQTKKNKADGTIPFDAISYTLADVGNHTYTITEKTGTLAGITYDSLTVTYTVTVADKGDGTLDVTASTPADTEFNNSYAASGRWVPSVTKALTGRTLADDEFEFELKEGAAVLQTKKNKADGTIPFDAISYTLADVGNHTYTITEKTGTLAGITYDSLTVTYTVTVADKGDGTLNVTATAPADTEFNNRFDIGVTFSKVEAGQGTELAGAKLTVKKSDGTMAETWISDGTVRVLKLAAGEYKMIEDQAPLGYDVAAEIEFKVNPDGTVEVKQNGAFVPASAAKITMVDELTKRDVTFSKIAAGQSNELAGAKLTVSGTDVNGQSFSETWISTGTAKVLKLKAGEYKMVEDQAPLGYDKAAAIVFKVELDGTIRVKEGSAWKNAANAKIQMVDKPTPSPYIPPYNPPPHTPPTPSQPTPPPTVQLPPPPANALLPRTGESGSTAIGGVLCIALAAAFMVLREKRK